MSNYAVIFCYKVDSEGEHHDDEDMLGIKVLKGHFTPESAVEQNIVDDVFDTLDEGTHVKFELYNVSFSGVIPVSDDLLMDRIKDDMENMLGSGELVYVNDTQFFATVGEEDPE